MPQECGAKIVKENGCNKLECPTLGCETYICNLCNTDITEESYNHFSNLAPWETSERESEGCGLYDEKSVDPEIQKRIIAEAKEYEIQMILKENPYVDVEKLRKVGEESPTTIESPTLQPVQDAEIDVIQEPVAPQYMGYEDYDYERTRIQKEYDERIVFEREVHDRVRSYRRGDVYYQNAARERYLNRVRAIRDEERIALHDLERNYNAQYNYYRGL